jgi:predicted acyl esterase
VLPRPDIAALACAAHSGIEAQAMILSQAQMPMTANSVRVMRDVMIRMRDGVHLATDIYQPLFDGKPVSEKLPGLLERTPYDKTGTNHADRTRDAPVALSRPQMAEGFARAGYVVAIQDCRGRYGSEGRFEKYLSEGEDGLDTLAWLREQPWCNGRVAPFGLSYGAPESAWAGGDVPGFRRLFQRLSQRHSPGRGF